MRIRDGAPDDAEAVAALADLPSSVAVQLLRDRTVRVAESVSPDGSVDGDAVETGRDVRDSDGAPALGDRPGARDAGPAVGDSGVESGEESAEQGGMESGEESAEQGGMESGEESAEQGGMESGGEGAGGSAEQGGEEGDEGRERVDAGTATSGTNDPPLSGVVAFDARPGTVHVTQVAGEHEAVAALLEEPLRFARAEGMAVELVLPIDAAEAEAVEAAGFEAVGDGPTFDGGPTRRYRHPGGSS